MRRVAKPFAESHTLAYVVQAKWIRYRATFHPCFGCLIGVDDLVDPPTECRYTEYSKVVRFAQRIQHRTNQ
jgi:hypothetical protein